MSRGRKRIEKIIKNAKPSRSPLILTKGNGDDVGDEDEEEKEEESRYEKEVLPKKKGKVIITRPAKSYLVVFTRRESKSKKKLKLGEDEAKQIIFKRSTPILQERLKKMEEGISMACFMFLNYETRNEEEKR